MKRTIRFVAAFMMLVFVLSSGAMAAEDPDDQIQPMFTGISSFGPIVTISPTGKITCTDTVLVRVGYTANITWELRETNGNAFTGDPMASWSTSGSNMLALNKVRYAVHGHKYQLKTIAQVYDSSGHYVETVRGYSNVESY